MPTRIELWSEADVPWLGSGKPDKLAIRNRLEADDAEWALMDFRELLIDAFGRVREATHGAVEGCSAAVLTFRADDDANSIALAGLASHADPGRSRRRRRRDRPALDLGRLGRPVRVAVRAVGDGLRPRSDEVAAVVASGDLLLGYHDAVHDATVAYLRGLTPADLDRIVDERWDPPVSLGVRLVSVVDDDLEHAGQAAFVRGLADRRGAG